MIQRGPRILCPTSLQGYILGNNFVCVCVCVCVVQCHLSHLELHVAFVLINEGNLLHGVEVRVLEKVATEAQTDLTGTKVSSGKFSRTTKETRCSPLPTCTLMEPPL